MKKLLRNIRIATGNRRDARRQQTNTHHVKQSFRSMLNTRLSEFAARIVSAAFTFAVFALASGSHAQPPVASSANDAFTAGPSVEGISEYTLKDNGLRVLLFPDASSPKMTVNITYLVGSRHEGYGETGMAHLLEHMLFKSTPKYPHLWQDMANRGFINNGTTWFDRTNYYEAFAANEANLKWALEMEADRMVNSNILREELDTE